MAWWVGPKVDMTPGRPPQILTLAPFSAAWISMKSSARRVANTPNVVANGTNPALDSPAATATRFCSAIPTFSTRSG